MWRTVVWHILFNIISLLLESTGYDLRWPYLVKRTTQRFPDCDYFNEIFLVVISFPYTAMNMRDVFELFENIQAISRQQDNRTDRGNGRNWTVCRT
jgi:hypothetical protein